MGRVIAPGYRASRADAGEAAEIAAFIWAAWNAVDHASAPFASITDAWIRGASDVTRLRRRLADDALPMAVVRAAGAIAGVAAMTDHTDGTVEITEIVVHPMAEHCGVGGELLEEAVRVAGRLQAKRITTHAEDEAARDFFLRRGFRAADGRLLEQSL